jgi:hypothetical protein
LRSLISKASLIDELAPLAKAGVPLLHVCDQNDPWFNEYTRPVAKRYKELGGSITTIVNENDEHHVADQVQAVEFIVSRAR